MYYYCSLLFSIFFSIFYTDVSTCYPRWLCEPWLTYELWTLNLWHPSGVAGAGSVFCVCIYTLRALLAADNLPRFSSLPPSCNHGYLKTHHIHHLAFVRPPSLPPCTREVEQSTVFFIFFIFYLLLKMRNVVFFLKCNSFFFVSVCASPFPLLSVNYTNDS